MIVSTPLGLPVVPTVAQHAGARARAIDPGISPSSAAISDFEAPVAKRLVANRRHWYLSLSTIGDALCSNRTLLGMGRAVDQLLATGAE